MIVTPRHCRAGLWAAATTALAERLASGPTQAYAQMRRLMRGGFERDLPTQLHAEGEALAILKSVAKDLATLLIVSQAVIVEGAAEGAEATGREDLKVTVAAAEGHKCERCWIYSDEVGQDAEHPTLCKRCAEAVKA